MVRGRRFQAITPRLMVILLVTIPTAAASSGTIFSKSRATEYEYSEIKLSIANKLTPNMASADVERQKELGTNDRTNGFVAKIPGKLGECQYSTLTSREKGLTNDDDCSLKMITTPTLNHKYHGAQSLSPNPSGLTIGPDLIASVL